MCVLLKVLEEAKGEVWGGVMQMQKEQWSQYAQSWEERGVLRVILNPTWLV